jgi:hypothetical protein
MKLDKTVGEKTIQFKIISSSNLGKEGYLLKVSDKTVVIVATEPNGLFYGIQTLKQMLPVEAKNGILEIPVADILPVRRPNGLDSRRYIVCRPDDAPGFEINDIQASDGMRGGSAVHYHQGEPPTLRGNRAD